jgi:integrase/recombinase XerD
MIKFELVLQNKTKLNSKGEAIIYLRLTKDRIVKYLATGETCPPSHWNDLKNQVNAKNPRYKTINLNLTSFKTSIMRIYDTKLSNEDKAVTSVEKYLELIKAKKPKLVSTDFFKLTEYRILNLKENNQLGTAKQFQDTYNSVKRFLSKSKLELRDINKEWLEGYEKFLRNANCIDGGISVRMRAIRAIYNRAISDQFISLEYYPFKTYEIKNLKSGKKIRSISLTDLEKIKNLDVSNDFQLQLSKNLFLFSYYLGGMNFVDMMLLNQNNIIEAGSRLIYTRTKTGGEFNFILTEPAKRILDQYKKNAQITGYLFPILLQPNLTIKQQTYRKHKTLSQFNRNLKEIGRLCNIEFDLTSYVARHSFATHLKHKNTPTDIISEALGHQNLKITQTYLSRFGNEVIDNALESVTNQ